jgi:DNA-binding FadR family transcriptional regulator
MSRSLGLSSEARSAAAFAPLAGPGRSEQVELRIREAIVLGVIPDGERLPRELELARQFKVAVSTVREALDALRSQGLVRTVRGREGGSFVTAPDEGHRELIATRLAEFSRADMHDLAQQFSAIGGQAAALAAARATAEQLIGLREVTESIDFDDDRSVRSGEGLFRLEVAALAQSPRLVAEELRLQAEFGPVLWFALSENDCRVGVRAAQIALVEALAAGDAAAARGIVDEHLTELITQVLRLATAPLTETRASGSVPPASSLSSAPPVSSAPVDPVAACAGLVVSSIEAVFLRVALAREALTAALTAAAGSENGQLTRAILDEKVRLLAAAELRDSAPGVVGAGFVTVPGLLPDAPWHQAWWIAPDGDPLVHRNPPHQLAVVEDPASEFFRDYTRLEWWRGAASGAKRHVAGPYVDYLCTDEYILTLTMPVTAAALGTHSRAAEMVGVAGADVSVAALERLLLGSMTAIGRRCSLVNSESRVIVATDAALAPGELLPDSELARSERVSCGDLPLWLVVATD